MLLLLAGTTLLVWQARIPQPHKTPHPVVTVVPQKKAPVVEPRATENPTMTNPVAAAAPGPSSAPPPELKLPLRQDLLWLAPVPEPSFAEFKQWTERFASARTDDEREALVRDGLILAEERHHQLADLIDQNPKRALELAVPAAVRRQLPADVLAQLEEVVSGRGDLSVVAAIAAPGKTLTVRPVERSVMMQDGRQFAAFTFGRRDLVPTRANIAVQGIALDGKLALTELPGRILEPVEVAALRGARAGAPVCPTSGLITSSTGDEVVVDWDGANHTFFCGPQHALESLFAASGAEAKAGGDGSSIPPPSSNTEGTKKLLIIRVDFPDFPGQVVSDATLTSLINNMSTHWTEMSFGKMTWTLQGAGSDFTPTLRLPLGHASYTSFATMLAAARTAATAAGYDYHNYTHEVVVTGDKPDVSFGGIAYVGARGAWLANSQWNLGVCSHEVGHNFGLNHAGFWDTDDGTTIGSGAAVEYGNPFDHMGGASSSTNAHFGARQKNYLDWIVDADVVKITTDGSTTTRIRAFDKTAATGDKAIAIDRTGTSNDYWVEYRQTYASSNAWMKDGVLLNWGDVNISNMKPLLLDWTPGTSSKDDCPLLIGRTFSDAAAGIHITPLPRGTDADGTTWIDVRVNRGAFVGNHKPVASLGATNLNPAVNATVNFTVTASDSDGDALAYFWDWGDTTFTANNSPTASKSWSTSGTRTVRCYVSDMKGMTATGQLLIQVGTSSTFFVQGVVATTAGALVDGVLVKADATHSDTTDSEGYYAITGLAAGSYTMTATKTGLSIQPDAAFFSNPVVVGPSRQNYNFIAPPGSPYFSSMKAGLVDQGSNTGAVIVPVKDADTLVTNLTLTGTSSNQAIIPDANIVFGTVGTTVRTVTVTAPSSAGGTVDITITATDPEGGTGNYVWPLTVNAKPVVAVSTMTTTENTPVDIDLRNFVTDDLTPPDKLWFDLQRARDGTVTLLPDGHTARFTPALNYNGTASFRMSVRDMSLGSRVLFLFDFEPPDVATDAKSTDQSNFNRTGTLEIAGVGGEYSYGSDEPPALAPWNTQSLGLTEAGTGAARLRRTLADTDLDYNNADWSFSSWFKRETNDTEDFIMHLGTGDGHGTDSEAELYFASASDTLKFQKWGSGGLEKEIVGPNVPIGEWHHVTLTYDRTGTDVGTFALYLDGFLTGSVTSVTMDVSQSASLVVGGHNDTTNNLDRWFDGKLDDVLLQSGLNARSEIWGLAHRAARHYNGLSGTSTTVNVTVTGSNQPPAVTSIPDVILPVGGATSPLPFVLSDAETEARNLTVTASTSNASVLPVSGISLSGAPTAWTSSDIGVVGATGSLTEDHGTFIVGGAGADIGPATGDEFRWVRQDFTGDAEIIARVISQEFNNTDGKSGVMMRESATATSPYALAAVTPGSGVTFQYRATESTAAVVKASVNYVAAPCWVRLVRSGSNFTAYYASDSNGVAGAWQPIGTSQAITFAAGPNSIGLAVTSKSDATVTTAVFDHLGGTVRLGGERTVMLTPAPAASGSAVVTLTANDGSATFPRSVNVLVDGAPPSTTVWNGAAPGTMLWSTGANWSGGVPPPSSRFSTVEFFTGQTFAAGSITSNIDTPLGHALNVFTLGGTGPATGTSTATITGNPLLLRQETALSPVVNLSATNGTGLTYNVNVPVALEVGTTFQGTGSATFVFNGDLSGAGSLTKSGTSKLILAGNNTYLGSTTISAGTLQFGNDGSAGTLPAGNVINNGTLRFDRTGSVLVPNFISGTGSLTIDCPLNSGTIVLSGVNSFTGNVTISSGALRITNSTALGNGAKTITLSAASTNPQIYLDGSGGDIDLPATIKFTTSNSAGAMISEAGDNVVRGNLTLASGNGDTRIIVNADTLTLTGNIAPNTTGRALRLAGNGTGFSTGIISNGSALQLLAMTKIDSGTWTVSGANTYSGSTTISLGTLKLGHPSALGNGIGATTVSSGGMLDLNGQVGVAEILTLAGAGVGGSGALVNNGAAAAGIVNGVASVTVTAGGTHSSVPTVTIGGGGGSNASATATLGVTAASFGITGGTTVYSAAPTVTISGGGGSGATATAVLSGGVVSGITITNAGTGYATAPTIAFSGGTVTTAGTNPTGTGNAANFTVSAVSISNSGSGFTSAPSVAFGSGTGTTATAVLVSIGLSTNATMGGTGDIVLDSPISGAFTLTKAGAGMLTLAASNSLTSIMVSTGKLALTGSLTGSLVVNGGILQGSGAVTGNVAINGGVHAPGNSPGTSTVTGNYSLAIGGTLQIEINGTAGNQYDQVKILGAASTVTLAGTLDLIAVPALAVGGTFTIIDNAGSTAAVSGTFANLPQNAEFYEDGQWWRISYTGGTGNDVVLTRIAPTPWQNWLATNFGTNANNAAISGDLVDFDRDGLVNQLEYALGGNPQLAAPAPLPKASVAASKLALAFSRVIANTDLTMTVQGSDSLAANTWTDLARSTAGAAFVALVGGVTVTETGSGATRNVEVRDLYLVSDPAHPKRFIRLQVTRP